MNRIVRLVLIVSLLSLLTGCQSDKEQAAEIHKKLEESASFEKEFDADQEKLATSREKVQVVYEDLLGLDSTDENLIQQTLHTEEIIQEKQQVAKAEEHFQNAYKKVMTIDENIKLIKDSNEKKQATELLALMKDRKKIMDTFFDTYRNQLEDQATLFSYFAQGEFELKTIERQIQQINKASRKMEDDLKHFNEDTQNYNDKVKEYFEVAE